MTFPGHRLNPAADPSAEWVRKLLRSVALLRGRLVTVSFSASTSASVAHRLGRTYQGAIVLSTTSSVVSPIALEPGFARTSGYDPSTVLAMSTPSSVASDYLVWVF